MIDRLASWSHEALATRVLAPAYGAYRLSRPETRPSMVAFAAGMRFRRASGTWSGDARRQWILARLRESVRRAGRDSAYYRAQFARVGFDPDADFTFDDFARLPVLEREHVRRSGDTLITTTVPRSQLRRDSTGGSAGTPTVVWLGPEERGWRESGIRYHFSRIGLRVGSRLGFLWVHHLDPTARDTAKARIQDWAENIRWFDCMRISPEVLLQHHHELQAWRPAGIVAYAGMATLLADAAQASGVPPGYPTCAFVTGAEKLHAHERQRVEAVFGCPVHERYGSREIGLIAFQSAPARSLAFDVDWSNVFVEPETDEVESPVLITKLNADGMPMLRYRIGDVARFPAASRPGHPALQLDEVIGREADRLWLPDGRSIHGLSCVHMMKDYPVAEFQVRQEADYRVTIQVVPRGELSETDAKAIVGVLTANLPSLDVRVERVPHIARTASNKRRPVISEVPQQAVRRA